MSKSYDAESLARRNTLACLNHNRKQYQRAGNLEMAALFREAEEIRFELIAQGDIDVGQWRP